MMPEPRFKVVTVTGYPIAPLGAQGGNSREGLSATVLDTFYGDEIVTFASESVYGLDGTIESARPGGGVRLGELGARTSGMKREAARS